MYCTKYVILFYPYKNQKITRKWIFMKTSKSDTHKIYKVTSRIILCSHHYSITSSGYITEEQRWEHKIEKRWCPFFFSTAAFSKTWTRSIRARQSNKKYRKICGFQRRRSKQHNQAAGALWAIDWPWLLSGQDTSPLTCEINWFEVSFVHLLSANIALHK